ncbi:bifunctional nuclease family protein [Ornithobacterium rhinotracheale]|uniref:bifunctional nuclease family protein n=1 Tax=Ornithobacterium rhinotracheale TaxID=28251 RepID=UPI00129C7A00|nr:bifunctional nuclease family protein [Ornithobacterium rhinotracheale]MCK0200796.1 bifunctional nuclease family protein [Ornithobacterium rhinotracheale]MRI63530.1 bifunctional nuclease family protein [Ornithobacterium rhinotracheale]
MDLVKLSIRGISYSNANSEAYILILEEDKTQKKIPIVIGNFEAQAIAMALEKDLSTPRPLTHDLFVTFIEKMNANLKSVVIYKFQEGVFFSNLIFERENGELFELDSRTSDAIALGLRLDAPIFAYMQVVEQAGVSFKIMDDEVVEIDEEDSELDDFKEEIEQVIDEVIEEVANTPRTSDIRQKDMDEKTLAYSYKFIKETMTKLPFGNMSWGTFNNNDLEGLKNIAINNEDYEFAGLVVEEIKRRKNSK